MDVPISCEALAAKIADPMLDPAQREALEAEYDQRCGGGATDSGGHGPRPPVGNQN